MELVLNLLSNIHHLCRGRTSIGRFVIFWPPRGPFSTQHIWVAPHIHIQRYLMTTVCCVWILCNISRLYAYLMWPVTLSLAVHNSRWPVTCLTPTRRPSGIWRALLLFYHGARSKFGKNTCMADRTNNPNPKGISSRGGIVFWTLRRPRKRNYCGGAKISKSGIFLWHIALALVHNVRDYVTWPKICSK